MNGLGRCETTHATRLPANPPSPHRAIIPRHVTSISRCEHFNWERDCRIAPWTFSQMSKRNLDNPFKRNVIDKRGLNQWNSDIDGTVKLLESFHEKEKGNKTRTDGRSFRNFSLRSAFLRANVLLSLYDSPKCYTARGRGGEREWECIVCQKAHPAPCVGRFGRHTNLIGANFADLLSSVRRTNANSRNTGIRSITRTILTLPAGTTRENAGATMARAPPPQTNCRGVPFIRIQLHVEALTAGH